MMRRRSAGALVAFFAALLLQGSVLAQPSAPAVVQRKLADITITVGDVIATAELIDHATSRDFLHRLPMTLRMIRSDEREYHGRPDVPLSVEGPRQTRFEDGDLGYWTPGGYLAVFLDRTVRPEISDLIVMGKVTSELAALRRPGANGRDDRVAYVVSFSQAYCGSIPASLTQRSQDVICSLLKAARPAGVDAFPIMPMRWK
ncbi:hypothetical protein BH10PSE18_BH10PSE18_30610 [soil metagenome]